MPRIAAGPCAPNYGVRFSEIADAHHANRSEALATDSDWKGRKMKNRKSFVGGLAAVAALVLFAVPAAFAAPAKDGDIRAAGTCTKASSAKLKLGQEDGRIEVEFEVDQNRVGRAWTVVLRQNGAIIRRLTKVTRAPSGSFEVRVLAGNKAGTDRFVATASRPGETCAARASF
jgi:hypothetical protein